MATAYVALLRGINVGGKNRLPMADLLAMAGEAGCQDAQAYIQSGNVVFRAAPKRAAAAPALLSARIALRFGYRVPVILRSAAEMAEVARGNPFAVEGAAPETLHVLFLTSVPDGPRVAALDPLRSPPDEFAVRGQEVYLRLPNGMGRTRLTTDYVDRTLATTSTARNWRTVMALQALLERAS